MGLLQEVSVITAPESAKFTPLSDFQEIPIPLYNFTLEANDVVLAMFQGVSGIEISREVAPLKEGGVNYYTYEFPGQVSFGHLTLEMGLTSSDFFWKWMIAGQFEGRAAALNLTLTQRRPSPAAPPADPSKPPPPPTPIYQAVKEWNFKNCFPVKWKLSELNVTDTSKIAIETLELSFDYFTLGPDYNV